MPNVIVCSNGLFRPSTRLLAFARVLDGKLNAIAQTHDLSALLQFFLNHRVFLRSRVAERVSKNLALVMTGQEHPHWLTLLGFGPLQPRRT